MTRLAATLGTTGIAAALMLAALQTLPSRDGGTAQAGTEPAAAARAWTDPPRAAIHPETRLPETTAQVAPALEVAPVAEPPARMAAQAAEPAPEARRSPRQARQRLAARAHRARALRIAGQPAAARMRAAAAAPSVPAPAPVRMAGPVGDILHGLGLD